MARQIPREWLDNYTRGLTQLSEGGQRALADALSRIDLTDRSAVAAVMRAHCMVGAKAAAEMAARFYELMSAFQTEREYDAINDSGFTATAVNNSTYSVLTEFDGDMERILSQLLATYGREVSRAANYNTIANGEADERDVRYARVPSGDRTCAWCLALAGKGFHYMTREAAEHTHRGCDCRIVPEIGGAKVDVAGYRPTKYALMWNRAKRALDSGDIPDELKARMERERERKGRGYGSFNEQLAVMRWMYDLK